MITEKIENTENISDAAYKTVFDGISLIIYAVDAKTGCVIFANRLFDETFGHDIIGKTFQPNKLRFLGCRSIIWPDGRTANLYYAEKGEPEHETAASDKLAEARMRRAMLDNFNEFSLFFQPVVDLKTKKWTAAEALLRWEEPGSGMRSMASFLPVLEKTGLIHTVNEWILQTACKQCSKWQKTETIDMTVSVNVTAEQLVHENFVRDVEAALSQNAMSPQMLALELQDSPKISSASVYEAMGRLKDMGLRIILDMSCGYTNLSELNSLPLDGIKTDYLMQATGDPYIMKLFQIVVELAHSLNLEVYAKDVEDEQQHEHALRVGCDYAQGYFYARPMSSEQYYRAAIVEAAGLIS